ncbi:CCA tRNA nucleotidyltransferase [Epibacterium sp. MM17-32]|uniref:CCA tRNA nucleotidyltransferase n=1 Tax=Epibacterium sp. MM17-32 TaxID=2917734 RepID=UPI001EF6B477|nr:CCA tRNA nucleotidyltransferase [Epibacterium sp. MM17-32]MCG7628314.1 CCA tRNA nucleotidyltransferase [Epibacterium sp. MM17-32]
MKIDEPWLHTPSTRAVCAALTAAGAEIYFVGGCVRNALLREPTSDLDLSTNVAPSRVMQIAADAGLKAIPTGIDHGTVTIVAEGVPHEVTTFRKDVATDGRRAVVAFATDIAEDARRRDFTMNALYARPDGEVVDPLGGLDDLYARRVRFIGAARQRIREDYLRILRYFRFHSWYGDADEGFDPEALGAIAETQDGLAELSRERVGAEMMKLLAAANPAPSVATMRQIGVLAQILPGADDRALAPLIHLEAGLPVEAELRLAALGGDQPRDALRLSKASATRVALLRELATDGTSAAELAYRHDAQIAKRAMLLRSALLETPVSPTLDTDIDRGATASFPISAQDLMPVVQGAALGRALRTLEAEWIASGFESDKEALLQRLPDLS